MEMTWILNGEEAMRGDERTGFRRMSRERDERKQKASTKPFVRSTPYRCIGTCSYTLKNVVARKMITPIRMSQPKIPRLPKKPMFHPRVATPATAGLTAP